MEKLYVIKIGGNVVDNTALLTNFLTAFSKLEGQAILVHGGGKLATSLATTLGVEQTMVEGRRITDGETLKIVTMVYAGYINKNIIAQLQAMHVNAIGLSGVDGNMIKAHKRANANIDYGFVGDIDEVNQEFIQQQLANQLRLVVAPITHDGAGQLLNTNADTIAQSIAVAMSDLYQVRLVYGFEKEGVLADVNNEDSVISSINNLTYSQLKKENIIFDGMLPKIDNAFLALNGGVQSVIIGKAEKLHELINGTAGTTITN
ncbi:MAG: acetylglutamate kinase [Sediminibacterium sp.]|nr:acetylglutamate kinase [Sediminibacterium sp.]